MNWFEGSIPEAIQAAKMNKSLFVVFIYDENDESKSASDELNKESVSHLLAINNIVAIKLEHGSIGAKQFTAIYPVLFMPAVFFIDAISGKLKEILGVPFQEKVLCDKITNIIQSSVNVTNDTLESRTKKDSQEENNGELRYEASSSGKVDQAEAQELPIQLNKEEESCVKLDQAEGPSMQLNQSKKVSVEGEVPMEIKIEKVQQLSAEIQKEKQMKKDQEERAKEVERRKMGQHMAQAQKERDDLLFGKYARDRKKEKDEEKLARERVKSQIAADREERAAKQALLRGEIPPASPQSPQKSMNVNFERSNSSSTRIKFRLPDGSSLQSQFDGNTKLSTLVDHLYENGVTFQVNLCSLLHPKCYTQEEMCQTLVQLLLVPSAIIIVKHKYSAGSGAGSSLSNAVTSTTDGLLSFMFFVFTPFTVLYNSLMQMLGLQRKENRAKKDDGGKPENTKRNKKDKKKFRKEGNIHRLGNISDDDDDDDDENNTWNGNSTQQM